MAQDKEEPEITEHPQSTANAARLKAELQSVEKEYARQVATTKAVPVVKKLFWGAWTLIDIGLMGAFLLLLGGYFLVGIFSDRADIASIPTNIVSMHTASLQTVATEIGVDKIGGLALGGDKYDIYAEIQNINENWFAQFRYAFTVGEEKSEVLTGFIMPQETKPILALNQSFSRSASDPELSIESFTWNRVDAKEFGFPEEWIAERNKFAIENAGYTTEEEGGIQISKSTFTIKNGSAFSFWNPEFIVFLNQGSRTVAVNQVSVSGFEAGESRDVTLQWYDGAPKSATGVTVEVVPSINFFNKDIYMSPEGTGSIDIRDRM